MKSTEKSLWIAHPTGNTFVRALLRELNASAWEYLFFTSLGFSEGQLNWLPRFAKKDLQRRFYEVPSNRMVSRSGLEIKRLLLQRLGLNSGSNATAVDSVYRNVDDLVISSLRGRTITPSAVYMYEDGAADTFEYLQGSQTLRNYELPIAYYKAGHKLLLEEAERYPAWRQTLGSVVDSPEKLERKDRELAFADRIIVPSRFVFDSLPVDVKMRKEVIISAFGSPPSPPPPNRPENSRLRILFAGSLTQRKGLADLFKAMELINSETFDLVLMGSALEPLDFYRRQGRFTYEPPRNHQDFLEKMGECDILILPSLVEGRALVQQEALASGLPIIVTPNAGGDGLVTEGETGFNIPIRSPEKIAEKIEWFILNRNNLPAMRQACRARAAEFTWTDYAKRNLNFL